jgi:formylglycine-generating enzyme required for sulfatase activity
VGDLFGEVAVNDGRWHHVAGVHDGTRMHLFVDGEEDVSAGASPTISANDYPVLIGANAQVAGRRFHSLIDDVRVHDRALSVAEVKALFEGRTAPEPPAAPAVAGALARGLVGHWKFDETEGTVAHDSSGRGKQGKVIGGAKWAKGRIGGAIEFDGKDDCVVIARPVQDDLTMAMWMKTSPTGTEVRGGATVKSHWYYGTGLVDGEVYDTRNDFGTSLAGGTFRFGTGNPDRTIASATSVDDGAWHHVAATRVRRTGALAVYVDGVREGTGTGGRQSLVKPLRLTIGCIQTNKRYFGGLIDDVRIYDRALSADEVKVLFEGRTARAPRAVKAVWNSWDVATTGGTPQATVTDRESGLEAVVELYVSADVGGVGRGGLLPVFTQGTHVAEFNHVRGFWSPRAGAGNPYAGKSTVGRGADAGEAAVPAPAGVSDLTVHPPQSDRLVVVAFVAPAAGKYAVSGLAARRVSHMGTSARYHVHGPRGRRIASIRATRDRRWVVNPRSHDLGKLAAGDRIYFGVDRDGDNRHDATETAWTITMQGEAPEPEGPGGLLAELDAFLMKGDHAAALRWAAGAEGDGRYAEVAKEIASVQGVCQVIEVRHKAAVVGAEARVGTEVRLRIRTGNISGALKEVTAEKLVVATTYTINREKREKAVDVHWKALALDQVDDLAREGGWEPEGADAAVARAYLELGREKADAAAKALRGAGDHPLAAHLLRKIDGLSKPPEAARSKPDTPPPTLTLDLGRGVKMEMVYVEPGRFVMGGTADANPRSAYQGIEKPKHEVTITQGFYLGKYEVTQSQYEAVMGANPSKWRAPDLPVEQVTWYQAVQFCLLASRRTEKLVRLPTETEWEYACRAGSGDRYSFGGDQARLGEYAWHKGNAGGRTHPVGEKSPNAWGLHDMHGNVWEWVSDWYAADYYARSPGKDPQGPDTGDRRLLRGGSWFFDVGFRCRSAFRHHNLPKRPYQTLGFRAVVSQSPVPEADGKKGTMSPSTAELVAELVKAGAMEEVYWNSLRAKVIDALAREETGVDTGIECRAGAKYLIVPHPDDRWSAGASVNDMTYVGRQGYPQTKADSKNSLLIGALCYSTGSSDPSAFLSVQKAPITSEANGRLKLFMNDCFCADNSGRIRVKVMTVAAGGADASDAESRQSITGRWYYEEFGNTYSREFTAEGKCIFRKGETFVWSLPYRMVEGKATIITPDGLVLKHGLTADGRLDIEGKFLASREGRSAAPARLPVRLAQGRWRAFTKGVRAHQGGKEFMLEVPARLE